MNLRRFFLLDTKCLFFAVIYCWDFTPGGSVCKTALQSKNQGDSQARMVVDSPVCEIFHARLLPGANLDLIA